MPDPATLHIRQDAPNKDGAYPIRLTLRRTDKAPMEAEAAIKFALSNQEQEDIRWYMEDYLQRAEAAQAVTVRQIEEMMTRRGIELFEKVLEGGGDEQKARGVRRLFDKVLDDLADLRVEIASGVAEAASIPWELMRDPQSDSAIALRVNSFVHVQSNPATSFIDVPKVDDGLIRLLYIVCRPGGGADVELRAVANRLLQDLGEDLARFDITALRPPTFEQLQHELQDAKANGRPYHIVHFDGHGIYADLSKTTLADWLSSFSSLMLGGGKSGKHGYLMFEHPGKDKTRPVPGAELGKLLHDTGAPILVLNACQSAMHEATAAPDAAANVHDEVRAIGSLAQDVIDQGIPAVLGMRYSVYVVTAAQYIGQLYAALAKGRGFGQAATEGRKHLQLNPDRWIGLEPRPLQDWFVPVVYEAAPIRLIDPAHEIPLGERRELDPVQRNSALLRYVPDHGFVGRDETLLALDRAFDEQRVVLLHAYAGQGKTTTAVEFARWYALTGGLGAAPVVLVTPFENHVDLNDALNQIGQPFAELLAANKIDWYAITDIKKKRDLIRQILQQIPVLWIWDNVEPVAGFPEGTPSGWTADEQEELALFLKQLQQDRASKVKLLLTSRRDEKKWLKGVPHRIAMPRMRSTDAANLALKLGAEKNLTRGEIAEWRPLLDYCQGNPLTLRVLVLQAIRMGLRGSAQFENFVQALRDGEARIEDADEEEGRDKSLGASLDYGFKNAFTEDELPIIALLHLFQGAIRIDVLHFMGEVEEHTLPEVRGKTKEQLTGLLERAKDTGLLTQIGPAYFTIHPALPWFLRQIFTRHYDEQDGRSSETAALRTWTEAIGSLGDYYFNQYGAGSRGAVQALALEEANLLHARRLAHRHEWWWAVIKCMQGLRELYEYQGRESELARLVYEINPDYCTADDEPISGREDQYTLVMGYRIGLALNQERDLAKAAELQEKLVKLHRRQAEAAPSLSEDGELDTKQRHQLRTLAVSLEHLGHILREQENGACVEQYREAIRLDQCIKDTAAEATAHLNLGHAYLQIPSIRDLDAAEAAYQRSLDLHDKENDGGRSRCIFQIGMVHHGRFRDSWKRGEPKETLLRHAQTTEKHCQQALQLCPKEAITDLAPMHNILGNLCSDVGQVEQAREHYEESIQYDEQAGDRHSAGKTRFNMAVMYGRAARREEEPRRQGDLLERAKAYASAALLDFQHYQGRAAAEEAKAQGLLDHIEQALGELSG